MKIELREAHEGAAFPPEGSLVTFRVVRIDQDYGDDNAVEPTAIWFVEPLCITTDNLV